MTFNHRLELLERELILTRRKVRGLLISIICLTVVWLTHVSVMSQGAVAGVRSDIVQEVIRANQFIVEDKDGEFLASLGEIADGGVGLVLDPLSWGHGSFTVGSDGVELDLSLNTAHISLSTSLGHAQLRLLDGLHTAARPYVSTAINEEGGDDRRTRVELSTGLVKEGLPMLQIYDKDKRERVMLGMDVGTPGPSLRLRDGAGKTRAVLGVAATETKDGRSIIHPESTLLLFKADGNVIRAH